MTSHFYKSDFVDLHYYKYGTGEEHMLCFHGFGMHGKQFRELEPELGNKYTFWGFDLFFHKATKLRDQSLDTVKTGLTKKELAGLILDFCKAQNINRFSVIGYSMGTHYATTIAEELPEMINEYIVAAPSSIKPGNIIRFFSRSKFGNKIIEKISLSKDAMVKLLNMFRRARFIDEEGHGILLKEIETHELRFNLYASLTYLRYLTTDEAKLIYALNNHPIRSIFIFGRRDKSYPLSIGKSFLPLIKNAEILNLNEGHEMINKGFAKVLGDLLS
ncbi:MAG TPA: alpha/beta hydrolase [Daejeonella sp.]|uniref:alpha/beta hydrolase n=1 Tax=Daejeonella sp. TaxID=2805397 RepID=UPI002ED9C9A8